MNQKFLYQNDVNSPLNHYSDSIKFKKKTNMICLEFKNLILKLREGSKGPKIRQFQKEQKSSVGEERMYNN